MIHFRKRHSGRSNAILGSAKFRGHRVTSGTSLGRFDIQWVPKLDPSIRWMLNSAEFDSHTIRAEGRFRLKAVAH